MLVDLSNSLFVVTHNKSQIFHEIFTFLSFFLVFFCIFHQKKSFFPCENFFYSVISFLFFFFDFCFSFHNKTKGEWTLNRRGKKSIYDTATNGGKAGNENQFITEKQKRNEWRRSWWWIRERMNTVNLKSPWWQNMILAIPYFWLPVLFPPVLFSFVSFVFVSCWEQSSKNTFYVYDWRPHSDSLLNFSLSICTLALEKASSWFP